MDWNIGDKIYTICMYSGIEMATIVGLFEYGVDLKLDSGGNVGAEYEKLFKTKKEARQYQTDKYERAKDDLRSQLKTEENVIKYIFAHCGNWEEYTDHVANEVGIEKVKEFFGIDIY